MLVLTRDPRPGHNAIEIGSGTIVEVISVQNGRVELGIAAPRNVPIRRTELPKRRTA